MDFRVVQYGLGAAAGARMGGSKNKYFIAAGGFAT